VSKEKTLVVILMALVVGDNDVAVADERIGTLMVHLSFDKGSYSIEDTWVVNEVYPLKSGRFAGDDALIFQLTDALGKEVTRIKVKDPSIVRGPPLSDEEVEIMGLDTPHNIIEREQGALVLRFPLYENVRYINLLSPGVNEESNGIASKFPNKQKLDLFTY
jgi:hypothetical protein